MGAKTGIEWTESTWNPIVGCSIVSPGCTNCYAMRQADRHARMQPGGKYADLTTVVNGNPVWTGEVRLHRPALEDPLKWGKPRMIFVNSMGDLFHPKIDVATLDEIFDVMARADRHTYQILTKRPDLMAGYVSSHYREDWPPDNVWFGVSVEDQARAEERLPWLIGMPAKVRFISFEPLLDDIVLDPWLWRVPDGRGGNRTKAPWGRIHWAIIGGESGRGARVCRLDSVRALLRQLQAARVPTYVKQLGSAPAGIGAAAITQKKGNRPEEWPPDLRVQEMPA